MKAAVERRRVPHPALPRRGREASAEMRSWQGMRDWSAELLEKRTGRKVEAWNRLIARRAFAKEAALRKWLTAEGVRGYAQMLLAWGRFGYPDFLPPSAPPLHSPPALD